MKQWSVEPDVLPQYDLLAMHLGLAMESEPWAEHPDEWTLLTLKRPKAMQRGAEPDGSQ